LVDLFKEGLAFKGGTSLSKVHARFFRLSEDLDFSISVKQTARLSERREAARRIKAHFASIEARLRCFRIDKPLEGKDERRQYNGQLAYKSVESGEDDFVKVDVGLREEVLHPVELEAHTLLADPVTGEHLVPPIPVRVLSLEEAYAEKVRAALTRREPAIRDFFDLDSAVEQGILDLLAPSFALLVVRKLAATRDPVVLSLSRQGELLKQLETQLKPVLRQGEYEAFQLTRVWGKLEAALVNFRQG
jgi:predicted nucleotidyltransferase component of viral defense system